MSLTEDEWGICYRTIDHLSELDEYNEERVLAIVQGIGYNVFVQLDEKPGHFGYTAPNGKEWHFLLRRARNNAPDFFEVIQTR